ncbi:MAG: AAA family ATPase, partial [Pyrinomonadaceae bacterium]
MIPIDPHRPTIDPRQLVREQGREALAELVASESGYIFQTRPLKDLCQSLKSGMPLLAEGERGGGKTEMVDALAFSCNRPLFELQGMDDLKLKDILFEWDEAGQNNFVVQSVTSGTLSLEEARNKQWRKEFLNLGEVLRAYDYLVSTRIT